MKITLNIKKENLRPLLKIMKRLNLLTDDSIESVEGMELAAVNELLNEEDEVKNSAKIIEVVQDYFAHSGLPVEKIWLFGSYAREEQHEQSDIDLMIRFNRESKIDLWDFAGIIQDLEDRLGRKVDLVREGGEKSFATANIEKDKILIYEAKAEGQRAPGTYS